MLKVLPIQSKAQQEELCNMCNVKFDPDLLAYAASVDDKLAGICQFKLTDKGGIIYDIAPAKDFYSFDALFVMGSGTLNFRDQCGIHNAIYKGNTEDEKLLLAIGFKKDGSGEFSVDLEGFFTDHHH